MVVAGKLKQFSALLISQYKWQVFILSKENNESCLWSARSEYFFSEKW